MAVRRKMASVKVVEEGEARRPQAAVAVFVVKGDSSVLLGKRLSPVGRDTFALPGGRIEFGETFKDCAVREVKEETGLDIKNVEMLTVVNMLADEPVPCHFVTIVMRAILADPLKDPENVEPDKCSGWFWYKWNEIPQPLFKPLHDLVQSGFNPFSPPQLLQCTDGNLI